MISGQSLYYAGDALGYLHVMGENGNLIDSLQVRDDAIISIQVRDTGNGPLKILCLEANIIQQYK